MSAKKIITVFGATGSQGGSVAKIFLEDPTLAPYWTVRAVTRDTTKEKAQKLQSQGAEVVAADVNDHATLVKAMTGADAVFAVTNYWETMDHEVEKKQGRSLVDAAKETGVKHFVWSSLLNITQLSKGALPNVHHFDSKAAVEEYARQAGIPATYFMPGFYMSNITGGMMRPVDGKWTFSLPIPSTAKVALFDTVGDTGKVVKAIVLKGAEVFGKRVLAASEEISCDQIVATFQKVFPEAGKSATYSQDTSENYKNTLINYMKMPDFAAQELLENMLLLDQFGYYGGASLDESHSILVDKLTTWEEFAKKTLKDLN